MRVLSRAPIALRSAVPSLAAAGARVVPVGTALIVSVVLAAMGVLTVGVTVVLAMSGMWAMSVAVVMTVMGVGIAGNEGNGGHGDGGEEKTSQGRPEEEIDFHIF